MNMNILPTLKIADHVKLCFTYHFKHLLMIYYSLIPSFYLQLFLFWNWTDLCIHIWFYFPAYVKISHVLWFSRVFMQQQLNSDTVICFLHDWNQNNVEIDAKIKIKNHISVDYCSWTEKCITVFHLLLRLYNVTFIRRYDSWS